MLARLQSAWDESVQRVSEKPCLTPELLAEFKALRERYTAPAADPSSTRLREMPMSEVAVAIDELMALSIRTAVAAAQAGRNLTLATLADPSVETVR